MTLIAAFRSYGVPALIGDFLVTDGSMVAGLQKKVVLVADNFALAWTGHVLAANSVVRSLQSALNSTAITLESVRVVLTDRATSDLGKLHVSIVGWIIDGAEQYCFRWNSSYPLELYLGDPMYDGTGDSFIEALTRAGLKDSFTPDNVVNAPNGALDVVTRLMVSEMLGPSTHLHGFGFSYEILLADEGGFRYIDDILYLAVQIDLDETGGFLAPQFVGRVFKYQSRGNCSLVDVYDPIRNTHGPYIISPVGQQANEVVDALRISTQHPSYCFPFSSRYYCVFLRFNAPDSMAPRLVLIQDNHVPQSQRLFNVTTRNELHLVENRDLFEWLYAVVRDQDPAADYVVWFERRRGI